VILQASDSCDGAGGMRSRSVKDAHPTYRPRGIKAHRLHLGGTLLEPVGELPGVSSATSRLAGAYTAVVDGGVAAPRTAYGRSAKRGVGEVTRDCGEEARGPTRWVRKCPTMAPSTQVGGSWDRLTRGLRRAPRAWVLGGVLILYCSVLALAPGYGAPPGLLEQAQQRADEARRLSQAGRHQEAIPLAEDALR
jgi:hypothetical protein